MSLQLEIMKVRTFLHDLMIKLVRLTQKATAVAPSSVLGKGPQVKSAAQPCYLKKGPQCPLRGSEAWMPLVGRVLFGSG